MYMPTTESTRNLQSQLNRLHYAPGTSLYRVLFWDALAAVPPDDRKVEQITTGYAGVVKELEF